jgi:hypothetical protein
MLTATVDASADSGTCFRPAHVPVDEKEGHKNCPFKIGKPKTIRDSWIT